MPMPGMPVLPAEFALVHAARPLVVFGFVSGELVCLLKGAKLQGYICFGRAKTLLYHSQRLPENRPFWNRVTGCVF